jgi:predicted aspartyl protease
MNYIFVDKNTGELRGTKSRSDIGAIPLTIVAFIALIFAAVAIHPTSTLTANAVRDAIPFRNNTNGGMNIYANLGGIPHNMLVDTGAAMSQVTVPIAKVLISRKQAYLSNSIIGSIIADGTVHPRRVIVVYRVTIGRHTINNVPMTVAEDGADLLLGLPELSAMGSFTIDRVHGIISFQ